MFLRTIKFLALWIILVFYFCSVVFAGVPIYNSTNTNVTSCGIINEGGAYTLERDFDLAAAADPISDNPTGNGVSRFATHHGCLLLAASDITLNCQGHLIYDSNRSYWSEYFAGNPEGGTFGILAQDVGNGLLDSGQIINCEVENFTNGIVVYGLQNSLIENDNASNNLDHGFWVMRTDGASEGDFLINVSVANLNAHNNHYGLSTWYIQSIDFFRDLNLSDNLVGLNIAGGNGDTIRGSNIDVSNNSQWAIQSFEGTYLEFTNVSLGSTDIDLPSIADVSIKDDSTPKTPGTPSVEIAVDSTNIAANGGTPMSIGISDGDVGSNDVSLHGPTPGSEYNGAVAFSFDENGIPSRYNLESVDILDITGAGDYSGDLALDDDGQSSEIVLPFNISMFGRVNDRIVINNNGFVYISNNTITGTHGCCDGPFLSRRSSDLNQEVTNISGINDSFIIAGSWTDLVPNTGSPSAVSYGTLGTAPDRVFVIYYADLSPIATDGDGGFTFQIKLYENGTSDINPLSDPDGYRNLSHSIKITPNDQRTAYPVGSPFFDTNSYGGITLHYTNLDTLIAKEDTIVLAKYDNRSGWNTDPLTFSDDGYSQNIVAKSITAGFTDLSEGIYGLFYDNISTPGASNCAWRTRWTASVAAGRWAK